MTARFAAIWFCNGTHHRAYSRWLPFCQQLATMPLRYGRTVVTILPVPFAATDCRANATAYLRSHVFTAALSCGSCGLHAPRFRCGCYKTAVRQTATSAFTLLPLRILRFSLPCHYRPAHALRAKPRCARVFALCRLLLNTCLLPTCYTRTRCRTRCLFVPFWLLYGFVVVRAMPAYNTAGFTLLGSIVLRIRHSRRAACRTPTTPGTAYGFLRTDGCYRCYPRDPWICDTLRTRRNNFAVRLPPTVPEHYAGSELRMLVTFAVMPLTSRTRYLPTI